MNSRQITLVTTAQAVVTPQADAIGDLFYRHLFAIDPVLRTLFPPDRPQARKLVAMLILLVAQLERTEWVNEAIMSLAKRHSQDGVPPGQYAPIGQALLQTLNDG